MMASTGIRARRGLSEPLPAGAVLNGDVRYAVETYLYYDPDDPWAVSLHLREGRYGWVCWVFARQLLCEALACPSWVGDGDVAARRKLADLPDTGGQQDGPPPYRDTDERVLVRLRPPGSQVELSFSHGEISHAIAATLAAVPAGTETHPVPDYPPAARASEGTGGGTGGVVSG